jgi:hypothetical protein
VLRSRGFLWLVLFALVAAQTLALAHRVAHGWEAGTAVSAPGNWAAALEDGHADDPSCQVFDQASQALLTFDAPAAVLPQLLFSHFIQWSQGEAVARWAALFEARGPPAFR